ncbi:MAG: polysaccharide deacetylase, partial [Firmicutes bacterium]|nr:polysaccharide deacetylase [Bacillota bacterium]
NHRLMEMAEAFNGFDHGIHPRLFYVWGHSYEFDNDDNWALMEDFCKLMGGRGDIWYATNIEIYDYVQTCGRLRFAADNAFVYNPSAASAWVKVNGSEAIEIPGGQQVALA